MEGEKRTEQGDKDTERERERKKKGERERWDHYDQVKDDAMAKMRF